ncbi:MAG: hemerythrin domain-containing protein [Burkholderiaceae bacterium]
MATTKKANGATSKKKAALDAIALLRADHKHVSDLFSQFEKARASTRKAKLVEEICRELTVHAQVEEEIFYPAFRAATRDKELVPEATVEHQSMKDLIAQVQGVPPDGDMYDAKVKVLGEYVKHHVKEEQGEMFPKAKSSKMPMAELGEQIRQRKQELLAAYA